MNLYNDASIIITPNGFKAGKLYAVKGADLTVTRATSATRVNANGVIETVGANVPLIDHTGGGCPTILVQPQRTNSLLNSATVANQTIITGAVAYTLSFYGSGTITLSGTHTATVVGLGTARKTYTFTPTAGNLVLTVSGTCTNGQLEAGSYATSEIPTTSAIVTRNADVISKTGISSLIGQTEGTFFIEYNKTHSADSSGQVLAIISNSVDAVATRIQFTLIDNTVLLYALNNYTSVAISGNITIPNGINKIAVSYGANGYKFYVNGVLEFSNTNTTIPSTQDFTLGSFPFGVVPISDGIKSVVLWKRQLTNAELAELTTI
jgi:hypothetical protein